MLSRIKVSHKLLLIYALDMIAVVFLGTSLAEEKYLAINFARRELVGIDYIAAARDTLFALVDLSVPVDPDEAAAALARRVAALRDAEARLGAGMDSAALVNGVMVATSGLVAGAETGVAITAVRAVIARIGDMSNLILDPDLDSYYTMSLTVMRYPELIEALVGLRRLVASGLDPTGETLSALAVLQGRIVTVAGGIDSDLAAGIRGNRDGSLNTALANDHAALLGRLDRINLTMAAAIRDQKMSPAQRLRLGAGIDETLTIARMAWGKTCAELDRLIKHRIDGFFFRMFSHFALTGILLAMILGAVLMVARRIARPIAALAQVADQVRITNDYSLRARWDSSDEIGRLVVAFNTMLERLQSEGERRQELVARARAAEAQRELIAAITTPLVVIRLADRAPLHLNQPAADLLGPDGPDRWLSADDLARLILALDTHGQVNAFEAECTGPDGSRWWALMSARHLVFQSQDSILVIVTPINERRRMEQELRQAKDAAERAFDDLREAQHSLIQAEKMASLGGLVAGVAHEISTPVGIGLTGASTLARETEKIGALYRAEQMSQDDFEEYLDVALRGSRLMLSNMQRAADLIHSFKRVAVDQVSAERRRFDLARYIDELLASLSPTLRQGGTTVSVSCPPGLEIDGYPGSLSQVLTNLILNAVTHGFGDAGGGHIAISAGTKGDGFVCLSLHDDGKGISTEHLDRVFDPFFTTRRAAGGSGLGLHIVYNIVTATLKGTIEVASREGTGTTFTIVFPVIAAADGGRDAA